MYTLVRSEFQGIVDLFEDVAEHKIYVCHVKDSSIPKDGTQLATNDIKLTGALKEIFSAKQDAAAMLEIDPKDPNVRILNFQKTEANAFVKCRAEHLAGQKVIVSRKVDDKLETYLDNIYLELK